MTTTITTGLALGTGVGGAGAALAVAGAVGLGVLGLAALASRGGGGGGRSRNRGRKGRRRHGRSLTEQSNALNNAMDLIRQEDITGCGLRLMCELAEKKEEFMAEEELAILDLLGPVARPGEGVLPPGGAGDYMLAKSFGHAGGNCAQAFPLCPLNGTQLMDTVMGFLP